jgi:hypothetical protein
VALVAAWFGRQQQGMSNMEMPTQSQVYAAGRHVLTASVAIIGTLATMHLISADDAGKITDAFSQIGSGLASVATGVTTLVGIGSAFYAALTASKSHQVAAVGELAKVPGSGVAGVITTPTPEGRALAESIPASTVVAAGTSDAVKIAAPVQAAGIGQMRAS